MGPLEVHGVQVVFNLFPSSLRVRSFAIACHRNDSENHSNVLVIGILPSEEQAPFAIRCLLKHG